MDIPSFQNGDRWNYHDEGNEGYQGLEPVEKWGPSLPDGDGLPDSSEGDEEEDSLDDIVDDGSEDFGEDMEEDGVDEGDDV